MKLICVHVLSRYLQLNVQYSESYRRYNPAIPSFLVNRPRDMVEHILVRYQKATEMESANVVKVRDGVFQVQSASQRHQKYTVTFGSSEAMPECDCEDWQRTHWLCKHFCAILLHHPDGNWEALGEMYTDSPYFEIDVPFTELHSTTHVGPSEEESDPDHDANLSNTVDISSNSSGYGAGAVSGRCRDVLSMIKDLTYKSIGIEPLTALEGNLRTIFHNLLKEVHSDGGIVLEGLPRRKNRKRPSSSVAKMSDRYSKSWHYHIDHIYDTYIAIMGNAMACL
jgi:hypothetical protein